MAHVARQVGLVAALLGIPLLLMAQGVPRMTTVDPVSGKPGDVITVNGENLQKDLVVKVYLTDGKNDFVVEVLEQTPTAIKFKIPVKTMPGRLALMVLTSGKDPRLIEQPVKVLIEE